MSRATRRVTANMVAGLDGSAAVDGRVAGLSNASDRALFQQLRAEADVVLVGAGTVRAERYGPVRLSEAQVTTRVTEGRPPRPPIAVVTRSLRLDWTAPLFAEPTSSRPLVITCEAAGADAIAGAAEHAEVVVVGDDAVDLGRALDVLADRALLRVLTEGGPALLGELIALDLLDELRLTLAPVVGGDPLPIASGLRSPAAGARSLTAFTLADVHQDGDHLFLRYLTQRAHCA
jgi:riboflavin biosynthesis pyrimidine reductase